MNLLDAQRDLRAAIVEGDDDVSPGVAIYRNAYRARLIEALKSGYDKVWSWVGDEAFVAAAIHHIILNPPASWTLDVYGAGFPATLADLFANDPEIAELAWLEWHMQQAFGAVDGPVADADALSDAVQRAPDFAAAHFTLTHTLAIRDCTTNATAIWHALAHDAEPPAAETRADGARLIVWRRDFSPHFRIVEDDEAAALGHVASGASFGALCAAMRHADEDDSDIAVRVGGWLGRWIQDGLIAAINIYPE